MLNIEFKVCFGSASLRSRDDSCVHNTPISLCELLNSFGVLTHCTWFKVLYATANIENLLPFCAFHHSGRVLPAPQMNTVLPRVTPALRHAWIPTDRGSIRAPSSKVTLSGNLVRWKLATDTQKSRRMRGRAAMLSKSSERSDSCWAICGTKASRGKLLLVAEVGIVFVEPAKISIVGGRCAEEDGRRQVVFAHFEVLIHLTRDARLDGHSVSLGTSRSYTHIDPGIIILGGERLLKLPPYRLQDAWLPSQLSRPGPRPRVPAPLDLWPQSLQFCHAASSERLIHRSQRSASEVRHLQQ